MNRTIIKFLKKIYPAIFFLVIVSTNGCKKNPDSGVNPNPPVAPPSTDKTFKNPVLPSGPDPFVTQVGLTYYYTNTLGDRLGIWKTTAMSKTFYSFLYNCFSPPPSAPNSDNLWAPEFYFLNNKWYLYYTAGDGSLDDQRTFVLENSNADPTQGVWVDKGRLYNFTADFWAIDGTVLELNNTNYFIWSGHPDNVNTTQNIYISKMTNPYTLEGSRVMLSTPQYSWETNGSDVNEGPEILKNPQGKIFLIYSSSGCWTDDYGLGMLTLKDNGDPLTASDWTKSPTPVFTKSVSNNVYGPGHNSFFKSPDGTEDWIIYHANPMPENGQGCGATRSTRMQKFTWKSDGTPDFGVPVSTSTAIKVPSGE